MEDKKREILYELKNILSKYNVDIVFNAGYHSPAYLAEENITIIENDTENIIAVIEGLSLSESKL